MKGHLISVRYHGLFLPVTSDRTSDNVVPQRVPPVVVPSCRPAVLHKAPEVYGKRTRMDEKQTIQAGEVITLNIELNHSGEHTQLVEQCLSPTARPALVSSPYKILSRSREVVGSVSDQPPAISTPHAGPLCRGKAQRSGHSKQELPPRPQPHLPVRTGNARLLSSDFTTDSSFPQERCWARRSHRPWSVGSTCARLLLLNFRKSSRLRPGRR